MAVPKKKYSVLVAVLFSDYSWKEYNVRVEAYHEDAATDEALDKVENILLQEITDTTAIKVAGLTALSVKQKAQHE